MQKFKKRKGFTLTELAIVIAVIAILIAVLVPTFISLINKAEESSDSMLVKNLNTSMSTYASLNGKGEDEIDVIEAVTALREDGYDMTKLTPTSAGANIVYDENTHTFTLFKDNFADDSSISSSDGYVVIGCSTSSVQAAYTSSYNITKYCVYAVDGTDIECTYDTDNSTEVTIYLYSEEGTVNINAPYATVEHYGSAEIVNISAVAYASYHLHGEVGELTLAKGHAELKSTAVVGTVEIDPATDETPVLTVVTGATVSEYKVDSNSTYKVETKSSDDAEEATETTVTEIASASGATLNQNITLTANSSDGLNVAANTVVVLDLNGYTLSSSSNVTVNVNSGATLTITDSSTAQNGTISGTYTVVNYGTLYVENGTITGIGNGVENNSVAYINGGVITSTGSNGIYNTGTIDIEGGTITGGTYQGIYNYGTVTVCDGTIIGNNNGIYNDNGYVTIDGGNLSGNNYYGASNYGTLTVNNGTLSGAKGGVYNESTATISGGTIKGTWAVVNWSILTIDGEDVDISGTTTGVENWATATITSGTIAGGYNGIYTYSTLRVSGNTIVKGEGDDSEYFIYGIAVDYSDSTSGNLTVEGNVKITATNKSGDSAGIAYWGNGEVNATVIEISGGYIYGGSYGMSGNGSKSYSAVNITGGTIEGGDVGYYHPEMGTLNISGDDTAIIGVNSGLQICAGTVTISGGTFTATASASTISNSNGNKENKTGDGSIDDGAALSIINRKNYGLTQSGGSCSFAENSVTVTGGTFISASGVTAIQTYTFTTAGEDTTWSDFATYVSISGTTEQVYSE